MSSQYPLNLEAPADPPRDFVAPSWIACVLAVLICGALSGYMPGDRDRYQQMFSDFHLKLPSLTQMAIDVPRGVVWGAGLLTLVGLLTAQTVLRCKRTATMLHFAAIAGWAMAFAVYHAAMSAAFMNIMTGMTGGSAGGP